MHDVIGIIMICGVAFLGTIALALHLNADKQTHPRPKTIEELDQEAALLRAATRQREALIEYELKQAECEDTRNFLRTRNARR